MVRPVGAEEPARRSVAKMQSDVAKVLAQPDMKERLATLGFEPMGSTPEEFAKYHQRRDGEVPARSSRTPKSKSNDSNRLFP